MASRVADLILHAVGDLRYEPTAKRVRARLGDELVVDSASARLVWEPGRVVPSYAVPVEDLFGRLVPVAAGTAPVEAAHVQLPDGRAILDHGAFGYHTSEGDALTVLTDVRTLEGAAFRPLDPDLAGYVVLDFDAFDAWFEEEDLVTGHPHDPFQHIDIRRSSRNVQIGLDGAVLADSSRPLLLFETNLPVRYYLPPQDVRTDLLTPSATRSVCAYKGHATYWKLSRDGRDIDVAWTYLEPLPETLDIAGMIAFLHERLDVVVDGVPQERPTSPWS